MGLFALTGAASAGLTYMLDPTGGRRRRATARDRITASFRRSVRGLARMCRGVGTTTYAYSQRLQHLRREGAGAPDDVTLTRMVESELFRHPEVPKGRINVDVADGVVALRGELDRPEQIRALETAVHRVPGVRDVHNFLHLSGTPAPNKAAVHGAVGAGNGARPG